MKTVERRIGDVIRLERRAVDIDPFKTYAEIGVRSFGKGIFHKDPVSGADLGSKRVFRIEPGDLVLSNVFAWEGAIALATEAERGRIGSHRFMTYVPIHDTVDTAYLRYFFLSEPGLALIRRASPGSAGRNRTLAIDRFEGLLIPLPDIDEQRRVVDALDRINSHGLHMQACVRGRPDLLTLLPRFLDGLLERGFIERKVEDVVTFATEVMHASDADREGLDFVGLEHLEPHSGRAFGSSPPGTASGPKKAFQAGDILYPRLRPYQNKVWLADRTGVCSSDQLVLRAVDPNSAPLTAIMLRSQHVLDQAIAMTSSLQLPRIRQAEFGMLVVRLPNDLATFVRRAEKLTDVVVRAARAARYQAELADAYFPAALNRAFAGLM